MTSEISAVIEELERMTHLSYIPVTERNVIRRLIGQLRKAEKERRDDER